MAISIGPGITIEGGISIVVDFGYPYNTVAPVVSNPTPNTRVGKTITTSTGTWAGSLSILGYYYQWFADDVLISGETSNTYTPTSDDLGKYISSKVVAYSSTGYGEYVSSSNDLGPVEPAIVTPTLGSFVYGGYYVGNSGSTYYIIASDASVGQGVSNYLTARSACLALSSNGYTDWILPTFTQMNSMNVNVLPVGQKFSTSVGTSSNYWPDIGGVIVGDQLITTKYYGPGGGTNLIYSSNTGVNHRAIRLQSIPT